MTKYAIIRDIGSGAFGNVYLLRTGKSKEFALKIVNTLRLSRDEEECSSEGTLMLKLCHTHLVHCYDAFMRSPHLYLVMELCSHGSVEQFLHGRRSLVAEKQICSWMAQMADVLRYLHVLNVIHRDLKPANIFLDENENIKLGDLGVARELDHTIQERHTAAGTLPYMSPEAFSGLPYNFKTDIWSLGCCIHEVMTLDRTFQGKSWTELHHMITSAKVPKMSAAYQPKLKQLVLSLLSTDSSRRPDALEILHTLIQIQGKRFLPEPFQPLSDLSFDHKEICRAIKTFQISNESKTILPLRVDSTDSSNNSRLSVQDSNVLQSKTDDESDSKGSHHNASDDSVKGRGQRTEESHYAPGQGIGRHIERRPLPVPKRKKKKRIVKNLNISNETEDELKTGDWSQEYMDAMAKDSIRWLRERFKPKDADTQISDPESSTEDENDDDNASGLVTLFTQSQMAIYINKNSSSPAEPINENKPKKPVMDDLTESVLEAAKNAIHLFQGQDPRLLRLMLIKIMGLRGFILYGQTLLEQNSL